MTSEKENFVNIKNFLLAPSEISATNGIEEKSTSLSLNEKQSRLSLSMKLLENSTKCCDLASTKNVTNPSILSVSLPSLVTSSDILDDYCVNNSDNLNIINQRTVAKADENRVINNKRISMVDFRPLKVNLNDIKQKNLSDCENTKTTNVVTNSKDGDNKNVFDFHETIKDESNEEEKRATGCAHYKRRAMFVTPCCDKFYKCRYCHDENETHHFDRKTLTELICSHCNTRQKVQAECEKCGVRFGKYTCLICNLFDDEDKNQYHCDGCGICRIGGRKNFFHCEVCNMCLPIQLKIDGHRCVENVSRSNCPVCLGDIHTSRIPCHIPDCGHLLHKMCFDQLLASGHYVCPTCQTSMIDMTKMWEYLDAQALIIPVPKTHENHQLDIFCNDCHKTSTVKFHFVGLKCLHCGGYNTTQDIKRRQTWAIAASSKDNTSTSA